MIDDPTDPEQVVSIYCTAAAAKYKAALLSIYAEDVIIFDAWDKWAYRGLAEWAAVVEDWFQSLGADQLLVLFKDVDITLIGTLGVLRAFVSYTALDPSGNELRSLDNRLTWVLRQGSEGWSVCHQHSSSPGSFETMKVLLKNI